MNRRDAETQSGTAKEAKAVKESFDRSAAVSQTSRSNVWTLLRLAFSTGALRHPPAVSNPSPLREQPLFMKSLWRRLRSLFCMHEFRAVEVYERGPEFASVDAICRMIIPVIKHEVHAKMRCKHCGQVRLTRTFQSRLRSRWER